MSGALTRMLGRTHAGAASGTPPTFVGAKAASYNSTSAQSISLTNLLTTAGGSATLLQDDLVLIALESGGALNTTDLTYTAPSGWTKEADVFSGNNPSCNFVVFSKKMGAVPDTSVTLPGSDASGEGTTYTIHAFRGVNTTTPNDVTNVTATGTGTGRPNPGAITPVTGGALIYVAGGSSCGGSAGAVLTNPGDLDTGTNHFVSAFLSTTQSSVCGAGYALWSGSGAFDPAQWTGNRVAAGLAWCAVCIALRPV